MHATVNLHIDAPPDEVWGIVSGITKVWRCSAGGPRRTGTGGTSFPFSSG